MYEYRARCINVVDGDTVDLIIDLGFRMSTTQRVRILGVDTPELHDTDPITRDKANQARTFTISKLLMNQTSALTIKTEKSDSFGRWLAEVWYNEGGPRHLGDELLAKGLAVPFKK
jgi:micrococcal nuclease